MTLRYLSTDGVEKTDEITILRLSPTHGGEWGYQYKCNSENFQECAYFAFKIVKLNILSVVLKHDL